MANEIIYRVQLAFTKGGSASEIDSLVQRLTLAGTKFIRNRQTIGTADELIAMGEVVPSSGMFCAINLGPTNFVTFKPFVAGTASAIARVNEAVLFRWPSTVTAPAAIADTAAVDIEYLQLPA